MRQRLIALSRRLAYTRSDMRNLIAIALCSLVSLLAAPQSARADNFVDAHYDASSDELVVTLRYSGTNPDHNFSLQWGACTDATDHSGVSRIDATMEDDQWRDAARELFTKTVRVSLAPLACRPAVRDPTHCAALLLHLEHSGRAPALAAAFLLHQVLHQIDQFIAALERLQVDPILAVHDDAGRARHLHRSDLGVRRFHFVIHGK